MTTFKKGYGSKWSTYDDDIVEVVKSKPELEGKWTKIAKEVVKEKLSNEEFAQLKIYIFRRFKGTTSYSKNKSKATDITIDTSTETNQYEDNKKSWKGFNAVAEDGSMMSIEDYCTHYGLDKEKVRSYKLVTHTAIPFYNIAFYETIIEPKVSTEEIKNIIEKELSSIKLNNIVTVEGSSTGVAKIADLHFGAYVDNLINTKKFSINILAEKLSDAANSINRRKYEKVHIHLLGDMIESFTGLSHKNTWKGLDKAMVGAEAVKLCCKVLHENFLSKINNLGDIKLVAGNHDRVTSDNKEDVQGGAAQLIGWGLGLMGYNVEFNPLVITHVVDGVCHILTHGHHGISKKTTKQLCWDYGIKGKFNLICEGHLHSIIQKLSIKSRDNYQTIKDDSVDHRRMNCPSFFTGNFYSESLGYTSESGFVLVEDNGKGVPNVFYYAV